MTDDALLLAARALWCALAGAPVVFPQRGTAVVVSPASRMCPPGWVGVVALGDAAIVTVPRRDLAAAARALPPDVTPAGVRTRFRVAETLGPAALAYLGKSDFRPAGTAAARRCGARDPAVRELLASVTVDDAAESGLDGIGSAAFVLHRGNRVVAAAGYEVWSGRVAHLCVLTADDHRGRGLARSVAAAAVDDALLRGLLPQWRAAPAASRRVASALGFRALGSQLSFRAAD